MNLIYKAVFILTFLLPLTVFSQPELEIEPDDLEFEDIFNRLENAYFINDGDETLWIDSIEYNNNLYYVRFDNQYTMPFFIEPYDTVRMDCILAGYYFVPSIDTSDTMYVYSNSEDGVEEIDVEIEYWDDDFDTGIITGIISDTASLPIADASVHFLYEGNYIIHSVNTDESGIFTVELPPGGYLVAAEKDSYYVTFYGQQFDPFDAEYLTVDSNSIKNADIIMPRQISTPNSVSGFIYDSLAGTPLSKGIIVVRNGTHTPTKIASGVNAVTNNSYTAFVDSRGHYEIKNIIEPEYYYIQSFSDYFVPSYYSLQNYSQIFWQNADSVLINTQLTTRNIYMPRDSSLGGGTAAGTINFSGRGDEITDVIVYAKPVNYDTLIFNYSFTAEGGSFNVPFLPYGEYTLIAQKIGYFDGYSQNFIIDSLNTSISNLQIVLQPNSVDADPILPEDHVLLYNYPNPFNPTTTIGFILPASSDVELKLINILGENVKNILTDHLLPGKYEIKFDGSDITSGTYFLLLKTKEGIKAKKILLLK